MLTMASDGLNGVVSDPAKSSWIHMKVRLNLTIPSWNKPIKTGTVNTLKLLKFILCASVAYKLRFILGRCVGAICESNQSCRKNKKKCRNVELN